MIVLSEIYNIFMYQSLVVIYQLLVFVDMSSICFLRFSFVYTVTSFIYNIFLGVRCQRSSSCGIDYRSINSGKSFILSFSDVWTNFLTY